jgi:hypothetical protein
MRRLSSYVKDSVGEGDDFDEGAAMSAMELCRMLRWKRRSWSKKVAVTYPRKKVALLT